MVFFRRLGLSLASSLFTVLLVLFALFLSAYMVLDKPATLKNALRDSGTYDAVVETTLAQKGQEISAVIPVDNPEVRKALEAAFPVSYLQATAEHNIDATYDWMHGVTQKPAYKVDVAQPKKAFADSLAGLAEAKLSSLPTCTKVIDMPATINDVLAMTCLPLGVQPGMIVSTVRSQAESNASLDDIITATATLQDTQGQSVADRMSFIPKGYRYFIWSLYLIPAALVLTGLGVLSWSMSRRLGLRRVGVILLSTGVISIGLAILAVWLIGKGAGWLGDSDASLLVLQGTLLEVAHNIGANLRNWLIGIGAVYVVGGVAALVIVRFRNKHNTEQNEDLNKSLGYSADIPSAGTTFGPAKGARPAEKPADPDLTLQDKQDKK